MADVPEKTLSEELKQAALADYRCPNPFPCQGDDAFEVLSTQPGKEIPVLVNGKLENKFA
jgi:hypothetical protein